MAFDIEALGAPLEVRTPDDMAVDAIAYLQTILPTWTPRNSAPEIIYIEALSRIVGNVAASANDAVGAVVEYLLGSLYGLPRLSGSAPTGTLTVTFDATITTTLPEGTAFLMAEYGIEVVSTSDATVTAGTTLAVPVRATTATSLLNGVGSGAVVDVLDPIPNALSVAVTTAFSGGSDPETDAAYIARAGNALRRVNSSLVVADHFTAYALESGLVANATTIPAWDGVSTGTIGSDAGDITVVTYGFGGQVAAGDRSTLAAQMQAITYAGATVNVVQAALESVNVTVTVKAKPGESATAVRLSVEAALQSYLNPQTWKFGETVRTTSLTVLCASVVGVDYVSSLAAPAADVTLTANEVATAGTLTVSVT